MSEEVLSFEEAIEKYDPVLGFEVHVELNTNTKMFDAAPNVFGDEPNTNITPVSLGLPGVLPVVNKVAVESAIKLGLALGCDIAPISYFARKNYFYPDSPKNFQTSQHHGPIAENGKLDVELEDGTVFTVEIERAHMEEDAGKLTHVGGADGRIQGAAFSLVDYNRAGVPLIEIVTRPIVAPASVRPNWHAPMLQRFVRLSKAWVSRMLAWSAVTCDVTQTCRSCPRGARNSVLVRRRRTLTPCARWNVRYAMRFAVTLLFWSVVRKFSRKPATGMRIPVRLHQGVPNLMLTITATFRNLTWCPWYPRRRGLKSCVQACPSLPRNVAAG